MSQTSQKIQNSNPLYLGGTYGIYLDKTRVDLSKKLHTKGNHIYLWDQMPHLAILQHKHLMFLRSTKWSNFNFYIFWIEIQIIIQITKFKNYGE